MKFSPEERRLTSDCNSKIKRSRAISRLLAEKNMTIEESMRLTGALRKAESECGKAEDALQVFRRAEKHKTGCATKSAGR
jgi:hypothetical protein